MDEIQHAAALHKGQLSRLLKITRATSRYWERDLLIILLGHDAGMRITEISRITMADVMYKDGRLRVEISLRADVTKGCKQRCAYLSSKRLIAALEEYPAYRVANGIGTELADAKYRGLLPNQPLIYSSRGAGMSQNTKRRVLPSGEMRDYKACDSLQSHLTKLYAKAGIRGGSSHSGRRSFAAKILKAGGDIDVVATLLGHDEIDVSGRYIDLDKAIIRAIFENAI
jgi:integrase/recombinase XerC